MKEEYDFSQAERGKFYEPDTVHTFHVPEKLMRLKQITLQGYKTFASKTVFDFEEGITAIVGPNGSGKSNIADALRWVLGEQSYRTLRGRRSTDMIFAGSHTRPRAGMAQAILTLDNSDGWLPIDYTEVEIGRRVYRSGENEYLLNGQKVRLRDLQELLATSGLAERTYTLIGQGLIDQALSLRAEERRALFEEAAGISHYKARRAETLRRLEETRHNLERIHDILSEINPRLNSLRRQAGRARNYEQVLADMRHLLRIWYGYQWERSKVRLRERRQDARQAEATWQESRRLLLEHQTQIDTLRRQANDLQRQIAERQGERERTREQHDAGRRQLAVLLERQRLLERQLTELAQELPRLEAQRDGAQQELDAAVQGLQSAQEQMNAQEERLRTFNLTFEAQQQVIDQWTQKTGRLQQSLREAQNRLAQAEGKLSQLRERRQERLAGRQEDAATEPATAQITKLEGVVQAAQAKVTELREQQQALQLEAGQQARALKRLRRESSELGQRLNSLSKEVARLETRSEMLDTMRHKELPAQDGLPLVGRLAALLTIPPADQLALEAALGTRLGTLVLADEPALWKLVERQQDQQALLAIAQENGFRPEPPPLPMCCWFPTTSKLTAWRSACRPGAWPWRRMVSWSMPGGWWSLIAAGRSKASWLVRRHGGRRSRNWQPAGLNWPSSRSN